MIVNRFADPTYAAAVKKENDVRDASFLNLPAHICGVQIRQMTPRDLLILDGIGSPFMTGGVPLPKHIVSFLWHLSPDYKPNSRLGAYLFARRCWDINYLEAIEGIRKYKEDTFQDSQGSSSGQSARHAGWIADYIDEFGSEYGWTPERTMNTPLKVLYQLDNCIRRRYDKDATFSSRSSKANLERLRLKNARLGLVNLLAGRARSLEK